MTPLQELLAKGNSIKEISFTSADHRYFDPSKPNVKYTSVTTLIGKYEPKFNQDLWSMQTALKEKGYKCRVDVPNEVIFVNGVKHTLKQLKLNTLFKSWQDLVLAKWKVTNEEACERGNQNHDYLENAINKSKGYSPSQGSDNGWINPSKIKGEITSVHDLDNTNLREVYPSIYDRLSKYIKGGCTIFAEKRVHLDLVALAGMIDVPIFKNGTIQFAIADWKTNKDELKTKPGYYKKEMIGGVLIKTDNFIETDERFSGVLSHVPYCKFNIYALQLSIYAYVLECWGYKLVDNGLEIIHIRPNMSPKLIKIPYMKNEVELIMKDRLQELNPDLDVGIEDVNAFKRGILN